MTNNQTIDGVPRKLPDLVTTAQALEEAYEADGALDFMRDAAVLLRALLAAPAVNPYGFCHSHTQHDTGAAYCPDCGDAWKKWYAAKPVVEREPVAYDPAKENKQFEGWARTQSMVDLRLCDIGLYYERQTGLAHDAWQRRAQLSAPPELAELQANMTQKVILAVRDACELEPADGDDPECICIKASDLGLILSRHFEDIE